MVEAPTYETGNEYLERYYSSLREAERDAASRGIYVRHSARGIFEEGEAKAGLRKILEAGEFEGVPFLIAQREPQVGDTYLACRNVGPKLLTAQKIVPVPTQENGLEFGGWIVPEEMAYCYDLHECIVIEFQL